MPKGMFLFLATYPKAPDLCMMRKTGTDIFGDCAYQPRLAFMGLMGLMV